MAVEGMNKYYNAFLQNSIPEALNSAITKTNEDIFRKGVEDRRYWKMGTTCLAFVLKGGYLYFVSAGDSHLYLLRGNSFRRLNEEHSVGEEMDRRAKAGTISKDQALSHPGREKLTSFLGDKAINKVDVSRTPVALYPGDKIIACTDGLYGYLDRDRIPGIISKLPPQKAVEKLITDTLALNHSDQDNITIQIIDVLGEAKKSEIKTFIKEKTWKRESAKQGKSTKVKSISAAVILVYFVLAIGLLSAGFLGGYFWTKSIYNKTQEITGLENKNKQLSGENQKLKEKNIKIEIKKVDDKKNEIKQLNRQYDALGNRRRDKNKKEAIKKKLAELTKQLRQMEEIIVTEYYGGKNFKILMGVLSSETYSNSDDIRKDLELIRKDLIEKKKQSEQEKAEGEKDEQSANDHSVEN
jgi:serine/threonine protein phosphatase PrpC